MIQRRSAGPRRRLRCGAGLNTGDLHPDRSAAAPIATGKDVRYRHRRARLSLTATGLLVINAAILLVEPALTPLALDMTALVAIRIAMTRTRPAGRRTYPAPSPHCSIK